MQDHATEDVETQEYDTEVFNPRDNASFWTLRRIVANHNEVVLLAEDPSR